MLIFYMVYICIYIYNRYKNTVIQTPMHVCHFNWTQVSGVSTGACDSSESRMSTCRFRCCLKAPNRGNSCKDAVVVESNKDRPPVDVIIPEIAMFFDYLWSWLVHIFVYPSQVRSPQMMEIPQKNGNHVMHYNWPWLTKPFSYLITLKSRTPCNMQNNFPTSKWILHTRISKSVDHPIKHWFKPTNWKWWKGETTFLESLNIFACFFPDTPMWKQSVLCCLQQAHVWWVSIFVRLQHDEFQYTCFLFLAS